jgi:flagellar biosynthesis protein FlhA
MADKNRFTIPKLTPDLAVAVGAVVVVMMLIIPLPPVLLDVFMAMNLLFALLVLLTSFYIRRAIDFSSFPTVLLVLTLFGIGLNVSSTRLILSQGTEFNGRMVRAFSQFVVGASGTQGLAIGFVIFIILIAVQALVITKGATRVAEVAARFTLDAMPTKQMGIQTEYSNGAITEEEARKRKAEVQQEADFYGAMDGSSKFVSGNVKLGIFITVINLVVGLIFGMALRGEPFLAAIQTYAALTIGDGLLAQLPSLLVSVATGIIVTRTASDVSLGENIQKQFSQSALIYYVGGAALTVIGVLPGFPWYVLVPMGALLIYFARRLQTLQKTKADTAVSGAAAAQKSAPSPEIGPIAPLDPLSLELGYALIPLVDKEHGAELLERVTRIRREVGLDLGLMVPKIRIMDNMRLEPEEYCFKIKGVEAGKSRIRMGRYMCMNTGAVTQEIDGEAAVDPAFGLPAIWVREELRDKAELAGYAVVDPPTIIATHLTEIIKGHAAEILGRQEVQGIIEGIKKDYPTVVDEVNKIFSIGEIQKVLQGLLREQVSIRNLVVILETMADFGGVTKKAEVLIEKVRQALGRQICLQYADNNHVLHVLTVAPDFLGKLLASRVDTVNGIIAALEPALQHSWISAASSAIAAAQDKGYVPVVLCPENCRVLIKSSVEREMPKLVVLSIPEIPKDIQLESLGEIHVK